MMMYADLVKLIKACKVAGVSELKHGELELTFHPGEAAEPRPKVETVPPPTDQELKEVEAAAKLDAALTDEEDDLASLQIDDPARFEELLVQRELAFGQDTREEAAYD